MAAAAAARYCVWVLLLRWRRRWFRDSRYLTAFNRPPPPPPPTPFSSLLLLFYPFLYLTFFFYNLSIIKKSEQVEVEESK